MNINFEQIPLQDLEHFKGGEGRLLAHMYTENNGKIIHGTLPAGSSIGMHVHETNSEMIYILSGTGKVLYEGTEEIVGPGYCHYCPSGHGHSLVNNSQGDLVFLAMIPEHASMSRQ